MVKAKYTYGEELANAVSHLTGAILSVVALFFMLKYSIKHGSEVHIFSSIVFGLSMLILYLASTLTHWLPAGRAKELFFKFDQIAIYILIAGTYTPFALIALKGLVGYTILGIEWGLALIGILIKTFRKEKIEKGVNLFFILSYVIMGCVIFIDVPLVIESLSITGFLLILIGGFFYVSGIFFFKLHKLRYHHLIWHIFVLLGSITFFIAIYIYALPII